MRVEVQSTRLAALDPALTQPVQMMRRAALFDVAGDCSTQPSSENATLRSRFFLARDATRCAITSPICSSRTTTRNSRAASAARRSLPGAVRVR